MIKTHKVYYPLYEDKEHFIILITGGRGSGKSYGVSAFIERLTFEMFKEQDKRRTHQILYTRYTMVSAGISVIPEFMEKIEFDGTSKYFKNTRADVTNKLTGGRIMFRGIKTSSGNQTAKLKSIHGITTFVVDEAEEWTSETEFETIMYSIRQQGIQNRIIIIMNPTDSNHFIYQKYIKDTHKIVEYDGFPVQISTHPNVLHIHTSYLDNINYLSPQFIKEAQQMKQDNPDRYAHIFMGRWADVAEGAIYKKWGIVDSFPAQCKQVGIAVDWGYTHDPTAIVMCGVVDNDLYVDELCYRTQMLSKDIIEELKPNRRNFVYADSADPRLIQEVANGGILIYPVQKGAGSIEAGIDKILTMNLYVTKRSIHLQDELRNYVWAKDKDGNYTNVPEDANNHACFVAETVIRCYGKDKPIVDVKEGDYVLTSDGYRRVTRFYNNGISRVIYKRLEFCEHHVDLKATANHPVRTSKGWVNFGELRAGMLLYINDSDMGDSVVNVMQLTDVYTLDEYEQNVYNIEVEIAHEYFANGILVHNCDAMRYYVLARLLGRITKAVKQ